MNSKPHQTITNIIGFMVAILLVAGGCAPAATPSPTPLPPTPIPPTSTPDPVNLVKAYEEAFNQKDMEALVPLFTEDIIFQGGDWITPLYEAEIRAQHGYVFTRNQTLQNTDCVLAKDTVTCQAVIQDDCITAGGLDGLHFSKIEYELVDGKIHQVTSLMASEDAQNFWYFLFIPFRRWVDKNYHEDVSIIFSGPDRLYKNPEAGQILSKLCKEYAATKQ